jgi:hypothetical protein
MRGTKLSRSREGNGVDIAKKLLGAMGIARDDKPMRQDWVLRREETRNFAWATPPAPPTGSG